MQTRSQTRSKNSTHLRKAGKKVKKFINKCKPVVAQKARNYLYKKKGGIIPRNKPFSFQQDKGGRWFFEGRPEFTQKTRTDMPVKPGDHRRHIIPSHLLLDSFTSYINENPKTIESKVDKFIKDRGVKHRGTTLADKLKAVSKYLQNNEKNLFPESGGENIAIGFLTKDLETTLKHCDSYFESGKKRTKIDDETISELKNKLKILKQKSYPSADATKVKNNLIDLLLESLDNMQGDDYEDVKLFVKESIIPSLELDLNKSPGMKNQNSKVLEIFENLYQIKNRGGLDFFDVMDEFLDLPQK